MNRPKYCEGGGGAAQVKNILVFDENLNPIIK